ncbi:MAG: hypothetical protein HQL64_05915 [Magnetococcales bacterium]|nr:hypothetical protein [Magnetococcales bacterium]
MAWEMILSCQNQLRIAPSGHILGIDMNVALRMAEVRGWDLEILLELLPVAETGMIEALSRNEDR